jgi:hypothetical protein
VDELIISPADRGRRNSRRGLGGNIVHRRRLLLISQHGHDRIMAQFVVVIDVLVAQRA